MPPTEEDIAWFQSTFRPIPRPALPEDCIEYSIHLITSDVDLNNDSETRSQLRDIQKHANALVKKWLADYIWQRESFGLNLVKEDDVSILRGRTEYGDSIEDEWVIVWLLRELTKKFKDAWIKVTDNDGEFLLIEASGTIPAWLEPDVAENRVWINDGRLKILKPARESKSLKQTSEKLSLQQAQKVILNDSRRIMHSVSIEEEAFYRLRNYPAQIQSNMHHALVRLPRKAAFLLQRKPAYVSPAIEAFYLRDPIALKALHKDGTKGDLVFPPDDLVTVSTRFPKVGYAQIKSQDFPLPPAWKGKMPLHTDDKDFAQAEVGMKLSCGFEMLLTDSQHQDKTSVREMKLLLEDLDTGDESLPTDTELQQLELREDDEKWLDLDFNDLEHELGDKTKGGDDGGKKREFGDKAAQENLQRIVKQFEAFLNNKDDEKKGDAIFGEASDSETELDSDLDDHNDEDDTDGEDKDASFDEYEFSRMMQEMMGMPPEVMKELMSGQIDGLSGDVSGKVSDEIRQRAAAKVQELDSGDDDEDEEQDEEEILNSRQMEAELRASGALDLSKSQFTGSRTGKLAIGKGKGKEKDTNEAQFQHANNDDEHEDEEDSDYDDDDDEQGVNDFDAEFARNILQSFRSSGGKGGPAANLLRMMDESTSSEAKS